MATLPNARSRTAPLNILDLPDELLLAIFSHLRRESIDDYGNVYIGFIEDDGVSGKRRDTQNARLVCRAFDRFASPYLYPMIKLPLETYSLDIVDAILKQPFLLEGIRIIEINLAYRPEKFAQSRALFVENRRFDLVTTYRRCVYHAEHWYNGVHSPDDERCCLLPQEVYEKAKDNYHTICSAWSGDSDSVTEDDGEEITGYRRVLREGHKLYSKRHEEQLRLITDGSFATAIARLVSQAPHPCLLDFTDDMWEMLHRYDDDPTLLLTNMIELSRFLLTPHGWKTIEELREGTGLAPLTLLATLPIAIQQEGTALRGMHASCFTHSRGNSAFIEGFQERLWNSLDASCRQSQKFASGGVEEQYMLVKPYDEQDTHRAYTDRYFRALLSSSCLEYISSNFYSLAMSDGRIDCDLVGRHLGIDMRSVLSQAQHPSLQHARIHNVLVHRIELESFRIGSRETLQDLHAYKIEVCGSWTGGLDILRGILSTHCLEDQCKIALGVLHG